MTHLACVDSSNLFIKAQKVQRSYPSIAPRAGAGTAPPGPKAQASWQRGSLGPSSREAGSQEPDRAGAQDGLVPGLP
jgi:hypothetical protein